MSQNSVVTIDSKRHFDSVLKSSRIVIADFYADWSDTSNQIAPIYERFAKDVAQPNLITLVKVNSDNQPELSQEYKITNPPTFIVFADGKQVDQVQGADPQKLKDTLMKIPALATSLNEKTARENAGSASGGPSWKGMEAPRGYNDITDQIELRDLEVLNADESAGTVRVLFDGSKPSGLGNGKGTSKDYVQSGADDQLLLYIPFQSIVKLHTLQLTSLPPKDDEDVMRPGNIHLYINRTHNLDFNEADDTEPTQAIEISPEDWNEEGTVSLSLRYVKFQKTSSLVIYVQQGEGDGETVRLDRVRLIGEAGAKREMGKLQKVGEDE
ncbi:thioredoxin 1 [Fusarium circinatum]|uniref:Thioredoxin 1 n=2 Tax=Fusarium fujikuroi species complex TaxID=171627 RepID=A0A8H5KY93_GIBSU|nr:thioredoxin 1 [Fusarium subglutinans]KAF5580946.1 thioredoxin 1 [Fusarium subglutinans]KAF5659630.1 thioredoxin 1 [Fusarium circinatum]